jgi:hypothetical protein
MAQWKMLTSDTIGYIMKDSMQLDYAISLMAKGSGFFQIQGNLHNCLNFLFKIKDKKSILFYVK